MKTIPVEVVGPSYKDRSPQLVNQTAMNMYLGRGRDTKWASYPYPGNKPFVERAGADRGFHVFNNELYQVSGTSLIKIAADAAVTVLGTVAGSNRCIFADDGVNLVIATGAITYVYAGSTVDVITSVNLETPNSVSYLNGFFLYDGDESRFQASDAGDPTTINALSVGVANSDGDLILRGLVHNQLVYWFGSRAIEPWYFAGTGDLPFDRLEQGIIKRGLGAAYSVAQNADSIFFLGADRQVYQLSQVAQSITTPAIKEIETFSTVDDAIGWVFTFDNQEFYQLTFPAESRTFLFSISLGYWVDLSSGMHGARKVANSYAYCYGKHFVADYRNGNIYELDRDTYTDDGEVILRWFDLASLTGKQIGLPGNRLICGHLQLEMEMGVGLAYGQGVNPIVMCRMSGDGGKTFGPETFVEIGEMGDYSRRVDFYDFVDGYSITARIICSDPIYLSIFGGFADVDDGGY